MYVRTATHGMEEAIESIEPRIRRWSAVADYLQTEDSGGKGLWTSHGDVSLVIDFRAGRANSRPKLLS